ncbi:PREDICTED: uncharacterized protein LOC108361056 [Rhagoletis zephyria]|uniref:uncharacterized protein LOC108361056 n=1 Tax=Rhagoletis zephyria TaxID=28612 RepID=UPI000811719D|nr:PREDICTED: uncharacterized protein LOC108361056 [Rhagoletis zephyria]
MGVPVIDADDLAGYDSSYANSKHNAVHSCNFTCSSSSSSSCSSGSGCGCSNNSDCSSNSSKCSSKCCNKPCAATLTLTFANKQSCGVANDYHYNTTEMLDTPPNATPIARLTKDLVGNSKEYRIENNKCDLRIIGNGNRIRIGSNEGNLQIIGNSTRLKITNNSGSIRYTGNEGRICLGSDSAQQAIDYIGINGKLKVVKTSEMLGEKHEIHKQKIPKETTKATAAATAATSKGKKYEGATTTATTVKHDFPPHSTPKKVKVKSASFAGDYSAQWRQFNELFQKHGWRHFDSASMPNLRSVNAEKTEAGSEDKKAKQSCKKNSTSSKIYAKSCKIDNNINIVSTYGNISIKNAVNVSM